MFFDYDGHSIIADDNKLKQLLEIFDNETDKGKLFISYPMVESLKHIYCYELFKDVSVRCKEKIGYKDIVHSECLNELRDFTIYTETIWTRLICTHLKKMNYIVSDSFEFTEEIISQSAIFSKQIEKYIGKDVPEVAVLSKSTGYTSLTLR